jgi:hypothetical protein
MSKDKGREFEGNRKEFNLYFGQECGLGRCYHVFETHAGLDNHKEYIYENDEEMEERFNRFESLEWKEKYNKKCQKMLDKKNK